MHPRLRARAAALLWAAALLCTASAPLAAQQRPTPARPDTTRVGRDSTGAQRDTVRVQGQVQAAPSDSNRLRVRPRTAFIRSLILPGWGQFSAGAPRSAAAFIALQGASDFMLVKTLKKYADARSLERTQDALLRDSIFQALTTANDTVLLARYKANPALLQPRLDSLAPAHSLVNSRKRQREDWITLAVFWTLASAVDALVVAELSDFPAEVGVEPAAGGGMLLSVGVRVRRPW